MNTSQEVGGAVGVAVMAAIAIAVTDNGVAAGTGQVDALADGFARAFLIGGFVAIVGIVMALLLRRPTATAAERASSSATGRGRRESPPRSRRRREPVMRVGAIVDPRPAIGSVRSR